MIILALVQQPRGVLHVLFAGDSEYWQSKQRGWAVEQTLVTGPVVIKFVKNQVT